MLSKLLRNLVKENKTLLVFMIITSVLTAIIGCFIYGVYQNYSISLKEGEDETTAITIEANGGSGSTTSSTDLLDFNLNNEKQYDRFNSVNFSSITKGDVMKLVENIPEDMYDDIKDFEISATLENDLFGLAPFNFFFYIKDGELYPYFDDDFGECYEFSDEEYLSGARNLVVGEQATDPNIDYGTGGLLYASDSARTLTGVGDTVEICGQEYTVTKLVQFWAIPFTSLPDDTYLESEFTINFKQPVTYSQTKTISNIVDEYISDDAHVKDLDLSILNDLKFYRTIIAITFAVALLFAINLAVLYKYVIEKNKNRIEVFRLCGSTRGKCIRLFLSQALLICVPIFALSLYAFHRLLYPLMVEIFPNAIDCLDVYKYLCILLGYTLVSAVVILITLCRNISKKLSFMM